MYIAIVFLDNQGRVKGEGGVPPPFFLGGWGVEQTPKLNKREIKRRAHTHECTAFQ